MQQCESNIMYEQHALNSSRSDLRCAEGFVPIASPIGDKTNGILPLSLRTSLGRGQYDCNFVATASGL